LQCSALRKRKNAEHRKRKNADNRFRSRRRLALKNLGASPLTGIHVLSFDRPTPKRGFVETNWLPELALRPGSM